MTQRTNFRLGHKDLKGRYSRSYVEQVVSEMVHRKVLNTTVPVRGTDYSRAKAKAISSSSLQATAAKKRRLETKAEWPAHHTPMSEVTK